MSVAARPTVSAGCRRAGFARRRRAGFGRRRRAGFGISIPLVVGLMALLIMLAVFQLFHTSTSLGQAGRDAGGAVAEAMAQSALEEALWNFQDKVNDPGAPLFEAVRRAVLEGTTGELDLTEALRPTRLPRLLEESDHARFYGKLTIEEFHATMRVPMRADVLEGLPASQAAEGVLPGEQFLDLDCAVRLELLDKVIYRHVFLRRRYGVTFVSPYKPFDRMTFAIIESAFLGVYPDLLDELDRVLRRLEQVGTFLATIEAQVQGGGGGGSRRLSAQAVMVPLGEAPTPQGEAGSRFSEAFSNLDADQQRGLIGMPGEAQGWAEWELIGSGGRIDRPLDSGVSAMEFPWLRVDPRALLQGLPSPRSVVHSTDHEVELEDFEYERRVDQHVKPRIEALGEAAEQYNEAVAALMEGGSEDPVRAGDLQRLRGGVARLRSAVMAQLPAALEHLNEVTRHVNRHTTLGLTSAVFEGYLNGASRRLRNLAYHIDSREELDALREELPVFNGHINYNADEDVDLGQRRWRGKTILSAPWRDEPVRVQVPSFSVQDPGRDLVVLNFDHIELGGGQVDAGVFVNRRLSFAGSAEIHGNLVLRRHPLRAERAADEDLRGTVTYNPRLASGTYWRRKTGEAVGEVPDSVSRSHYTVGLAPRGQERVVFRSPEAVVGAMEGDAS